MTTLSAPPVSQHLRSPAGPVDPRRILRLRLSLAQLLGRGDELALTFYAMLFERYPAVRPLFPQDMTEQRAKLAKALAWVVAHVDRPDEMLPGLQELGRRHAEYGARPEHYPLVRDTLVEAMARTAGAAWGDRLAEDWRWSIDLIARQMIEAAPHYPRSSGT